MIYDNHLEETLGGVPLLVKGFFVFIHELKPYKYYQ